MRLLLLATAVLLVGETYSQSDSLNETLNKQFAPLKWRSIGPFRGGRSNAVSGVPGDITTYFMGTTGGGLWKTNDLGTTWNNVSDGWFNTGSIGAITVAQNDANVVYVGMGEHAVRGVMTHKGDGVYKSTDGGSSWKHLGLMETQHISRIIVHPKNSEQVLVGALGALYGPNKERGIFKSVDGGTTWKNVLYINNETGCIELSQAAQNPRIIYAAMWEFGRKPWQIKSGGPGSGLYKSVDGGDTWQRLTNGLPQGMGKMAIAVSPSNVQKVYALIESDWEQEAGGLYVSEDGGENWQQVTSNHRLIQRAWYYIRLYIDPLNDQQIYVLSAPALKSTDGGKSWEDVDGPHGDYHDLWINPQNPANMVIADDGGAGITVNGGATWTTQANMPTGQIYRLNVDNLQPYNIYGGQQDNTSIRIASAEYGASGITSRAWDRSAGGESAFLAFDPNDPRFVAGGSYQGTIELLDTKTKTGINIMAAPIQYLGNDAKDNRYRFNWNAPIIYSWHEPNTFYHGAQVLLKTSDGGKSWKEISPDLTRNEKAKQGKPGVPYTNEAVGAENYGTLSYVIESPLEKGLIYTGSDDGLVYMTNNNGVTWKNITPVGLTECLINAIEVSPHTKGTVYIATTRYKFNDAKPGLYKSTDYGKTWSSLNSGIPNEYFTRVVREDDVRKGLLYAGTERGVFISYDAGKTWKSFQLNLPNAPITDLKVHRNNLIAATSGRAIWILDDLNLVRQYEKPALKASLFKPENVLLVNAGSEMNGANPSGVNPSRGVNPATGMVVYYTLPHLDKDQEVQLEIKDNAGKLVRKFSSKRDSTQRRWEGGPNPEPQLPHKPGLNRFVWNLRHSTLPGIPDAYIEASYAGRRAVPGNYTLVLRADTTLQTTAQIIANPNWNAPESEYAAADRLMAEMELAVANMHKRTNSLNAKRRQLDELLKILTNDTLLKTLKQEGATLSTDLRSWDESMIQRRSKAYDDVENFPNKFTANYMYLMNQSENDLPQVNQPNLELLRLYNTEMEKLLKQADTLEARIADYNKKLAAQGIGAIWTK